MVRWSPFPIVFRALADEGQNPPRKILAKNMLDWEVFFEAKDQGVIPLVRQAQSLDTLQKCYAVTVSQLFRRDGDGDRRRTFEALFHELVGVGDQDLDSVKERLTVVFRHIKEERKARVAALLAAKQAEEAAATERRQAQMDLEAEEAPARPLDATPPPAASEEPTGPTPREAFKEIFAQLIINRLLIMQADQDWCRSHHVKVPFFCSDAFATLYKSLLIDHLGDAMAEHFPSLITRIKLKDPAERLGYTLESLEDRKYRRVLWETWQGVWARMTQEQVAPKKPAPGSKKKGLLESLTSLAGDKAPDEMTVWRKKVAQVEEHNTNCRLFWEKLTASSKHYEPPTVEDSTLLMQLFGRSISGLTKDITALRQIAGQGGEVGRAFDGFQKGKNLDLPLTVVSFQCPDLYLDENKKILKKYLGGVSPEERQAVYPLTLRFLAEYL
ncbi:hypothetical protein JCM17960_19560 [Magnetospira thiophila]